MLLFRSSFRRVKAGLALTVLLVCAAGTAHAQSRGAAALRVAEGPQPSALQPSAPQSVLVRPATYGTRAVLAAHFAPAPRGPAPGRKAFAFEAGAPADGGGVAAGGLQQRTTLYIVGGVLAAGLLTTAAVLLAGGDDDGGGSSDGSGELAPPPGRPN